MNEALALTGVLLTRLNHIEKTRNNFTTECRMIKRKLWETKNLLNKAIINHVIPKDGIGDIERILSDMEKEMITIKDLTDLERYCLYCQTCMANKGLSKILSTLEDLSLELSDAMEFFRTYLQLELVKAVQSLNANTTSMKFSNLFRTNDQSIFWYKNFNDNPFTSVELFSKALRSLYMHPLHLCLHVALGLKNAQEVITVESVAANFGEMTPLEWIKTSAKGLSRTVGFAGHSDRITAVCHNQTNFATASEDRTIKIFKDLRMINLFIGHSRKIIDIKMSKSTLYSTSEDHTIKAWDIFTGAEIFNYYTGQAYAYKLVIIDRIGVGFILQDISDTFMCLNEEGQIIKQYPLRYGVVTSMSCNNDVLMMGFMNGNISFIKNDEEHKHMKLYHPCGYIDFINELYGIVGGKNSVTCVRNKEIFSVDIPQQYVKVIAVKALRTDLFACIYTHEINHIHTLCLINDTKQNKYNINYSKKITVGDIISDKEIILGFSDGTTTLYGLENNCLFLRVVIPACKKANIFSEVTTSGNSFPIGITNDGKYGVIGPRILKEKTYGAHGIKLNTENTTLLWNISTNEINSIDAVFEGSKCYCSYKSNQWIIAKHCCLEFVSFNGTLLNRIILKATPANMYVYNNDIIFIEFKSEKDNYYNVYKLVISTEELTLWKSECRVMLLIADESLLFISNGSGLEYVSTLKNTDVIPITIQIQIDYKKVTSCLGENTDIVCLSKNILFYVSYEKAEVSYFKELNESFNDIQSFYDHEVIVYGHGGKFISYSIYNFKKNITYITHPSTEIQTSVEKDDYTVVWDSRGSLQYLSVDTVKCEEIVEQESSQNINLIEEKEESVIIPTPRTSFYLTR
ncbi:WD40 repeat-containing protein [Tetraselmis virus 1]|uniref:WD40 repeat-containing protein n=1 Tax=Tetraselmis virus 1 TaxID=2060617 RepID=A0A2P0VP01_9VIRU|nr:WD40 repeat-containing protein [Tetraselmis virus 1]AUF82621.1 WD40 repeat-containing protein [Tetraselmis virus 1]